MIDHGWHSIKLEEKAVEKFPLCKKAMLSLKVILQSDSERWIIDAPEVEAYLREQGKKEFIEATKLETGRGYKKIIADLFDLADLIDDAPREINKLRREETFELLRREMAEKLLKLLLDSK